MLSRQDRFDLADGVSATPLGDDCIEIRLTLRLDDIARGDEGRRRDPPTAAPTTGELVQLADRIFEARRARYRLLDRSLFGEPAWDMLLALYCLPHRGEVLTVTSLTHAAEASGSTGLRWQALLVREELIERVADSADGRRQLIRLTAKGRAVMESYLTRLYRATPAGLPDAPVDRR
ncbi:MarR family winged helix-turn-helix transcriptional regulator [Sphingomonas humi]|uniref:MarR family transcriptional regulator n=1 Tax=Sphingomonas humi TaxID=335630 RepID=A0ABP7RH51_9SPHN